MKWDYSEMFTGILERVPFPNIADERRRACLVEIALFFLECVIERPDIDMLPGLLSGYPIPSPDTSHWTTRERQIWARAGVILRDFRRVTDWRQACRAYRSIDERFRGYDISDGGVTRRQELSLFADRFDAYMELFTVSWRRKKLRQKVASEGTYVYRTADGWGSTHVPNVPTAAHDEQPPSYEPTPERKPWVVSRADLRRVAAGMDDQRGDWLKRLENVRYLSLIGQSDLVIDGFTHVAGMVSAGKTTLMFLLTALAQNEDIHVTLIAPNIGEVLKWVSQLSELGIEALPILGLSGKGEHLERYATLYGQSIEPSLRYLSPACQLQGSVESLTELGQEPCARLRRNPDSNQRFSCPLIATCDKYEADRALHKTRVWITTMAGLIHRKVRDGDEEMLLSEVIYRHSDVLIVDEVDENQERTETSFTTSVTLVGNNGQGALQGLIRRVADSVDKANMAPLRDPRVKRLRYLLHQAQDATDSLYNLLIREERDRFRFTSWSLLQDFLNRSQNDDDDALQKAIHKFADDPLLDLDGRAPKENILWEMANNIISGEYDDAEITEWIAEQKIHPIDQMDACASLLKLGLVTTYLEHALREIQFLIPELGSGRIELELDVVELIPNVLRDYDDVVPEPPVGVLLQFEYFKSTRTLQFTRWIGNGRWFLLNFSHLWENLNGSSGPHVLALSGSSWAPKSYRHHVYKEPVGLLMPEPSVLSGTKVNCMVWHRDLVRVSGTKRKLDALREMTKALLYMRGSDGRTDVERERERLLNDVAFRDRARIVLMVNSYEQSRVVYDTIRQFRADLIDHVRLLVRDDEFVDDNPYMIPRSQIPKFVDEEGWLLIASTPAFGRAYNVVLDDGRAALSSLFWMVRPYPVADNPHDLAAELNHWALQYMDKAAPLPAVEAYKQFRQRARKVYWSWITMSPFFSGKSSDQRESLIWWEIAIHMQAIGRFIRGGCPVNVHFCDAAYTSDAERGGSILAEMRRILEREQHPLARPLYGKLYEGLSQLGEMIHV